MAAFSSVSDFYSRQLLDVLSENRPSAKRLAVQCDVIFGAPSAGCQGTGICKIAARGERAARARHCRQTLAFAAKGPEGRGIQLFFFREHLCMQLMRLHFRHGVVVVQEPCRLPKHLVGHLGLNLREIPAGNYPLEEAFGYYKLTIS